MWALLRVVLCVVVIFSIYFIWFLLYMFTFLSNHETVSLLVPVLDLAYLIFFSSLWMLVYYHKNIYMYIIKIRKCEIFFLHTTLCTFLTLPFWLSMCFWLYICMCVSVCVCVCVFIFVCLCVCIYVYLCVTICLSVFVCMYM